MQNNINSVVVLDIPVTDVFGMDLTGEVNMAKTRVSNNTGFSNRWKFDYSSTIENHFFTHTITE
jgi:hypothetical protein